MAFQLDHVNRLSNILFESAPDSAYQKSYQVIRKLKLTFLLNKALSPYGGYYPTLPEGVKTPGKYSYFRKSINRFIDELPKYDGLILRIHPDFNYMLPFVEKGFQIIPRFTYVLNLSSSLDDIRAGFKESLRREISKAAKGVTVVEGKPDDLLELKQLNKATSPINFDLGVLNEAVNQEFYSILSAKQEDKIIAAILLFNDSSYCYYLEGAVHPEHRTSGALSLLLWEGIQKAKTNGLNFDFEGSMIPSIEKYFSTFGAEIRPYFQIEHYPNPLAKAAVKAKKVLG